MSVSFDTAVSSGLQFTQSSPLTLAVTIGNNPNRAVGVQIITYSLNSIAPASMTVTLGGVSGSLVSGTDSGTGSTARAMIFSVIAPATGSQTLSVSWTGGATPNIDIAAISVFNVDQITPCNNGTFNASTSQAGANTSVTITSISGDLTFSCAATQNTWVTPFTNQTLKWGIDSSALGGDVGPGTGTTTHTWSAQFANEDTCASGANFKSGLTTQVDWVGSVSLPRERAVRNIGY